MSWDALCRLDAYVANPEVKVEALLRQHRFRLVCDPRYITSSSPIPVHSEISNPTPAPDPVRVATVYLQILRALEILRGGRVR